MTETKEKAKELIDRILNIFEDDEMIYLISNNNELYEAQIKCALIIIDEKIETLNKISVIVDCFDLRDYYLEVKQEIKKYLSPI
jgi:hypothetical protein